jgi:hypothetical protein
MKGSCRTLSLAFEESCVEVVCDEDRLATDLRQRVGLPGTDSVKQRRTILRLACRNLAPGWIELSDSSGRSERGPLDYIAYHVRKWSTDAFMAATVDLVWLHAAAAVRDRAALLITGPAGAGKSSLSVRLLETGWRLLADDATPVNPSDLTALPLAFNPDFRQFQSSDGSAGEFLHHPKTLVTLQSDQISFEAARVEAIVMPEFGVEDGPVSISRLMAVPAARALLAQCLHFCQDKPCTVSALFHMARSVPAWRVTYHDPASAAAKLTNLWTASLRRHARSA